MYNAKVEADAGPCLSVSRTVGIQYVVYNTRDDRDIISY